MTACARNLGWKFLVSDGWQLNNMGSPQQQASPLTPGPELSPGLPPTASQPHTPTPPSPTVGPVRPVQYHLNVNFDLVPFHHTIGRNVCLSADRTFAVRRSEEYCNGYVFLSRPVICGEKIVVQILAVDAAYTGALAFGMTSCDPNTIIPEELPDDSDSLLDRPEYWIVNKDVCACPEVGDELSFHITEEGKCWASFHIINIQRRVCI